MQIYCSFILRKKTLNQRAPTHFNRFKLLVERIELVPVAVFASLIVRSVLYTVKVDSYLLLIACNYLRISKQISLGVYAEVYSDIVYFNFIYISYLVFDNVYLLKCNVYTLFICSFSSIDRI